MGRRIDIIGKTYGRLFVESFSHSVGYAKYFNCLCTCGKKCIVYKGNLLSGKQKSCGCLRDEIIGSLNKKPDGYVRLGKIYNGMKSRCYNPRNNRYFRYGGRGIKICDEWLSDIDSFRKWAIDNGYKDGLSIDRINNDSDYSPNNCRWVKPAEQLNNFSKNVYLDYNNEHLTITQWAHKLGMKPSTLHNRIRVKGWSLERALTEPVRKCNRKNHSL